MDVGLVRGSQIRVFAGLIAALGVWGCAEDSTQSTDPSCDGAKCDATGDEGETDAPRTCFGVRGNGQLIFAHFGSLARIYENYGLMWGASGGSSGSITTFIADSIQLNPQLTDCGDEACSADEAGNRAALLFKSIEGYLGVLGQTEEAVALLQLGPLVAKIQEAGIEDLAAEDAQAAQAALLELLQSEDLRDLVNEELIDMIVASPDPAFHVSDVAGAVSTLAEFNADDDVIFVRPGIIDFGKFAEKIGRIANFYAAYGPYDDAGMADFFESCATPGKGMMWSEVAGLPAGDGATCGSLFADLAKTYREALLADEDSFDKRIDDAVGSNMHVLISTSVLEGDAVGQWKSSLDAYLAAERRPLGIDFDDVRFGYFGAEEDLDRVEGNPENHPDAKTRKFRSLGEVKWRTALGYSPAEPGLTRALEISDAQVSAGGWSDLHPTLVLDNLGCEQTIYVTRRGATSNFVSHDRRDDEAEPGGVATLLGMTDAQWAELYDVLSPSAFDRSLRVADAVWCTNWNEQTATDIKGTVDDAYNALLVSDDEFWTSAYAEHGDGEGIAGCASVAPTAAD